MTKDDFELWEKLKKTVTPLKYAGDKTPKKRKIFSLFTPRLDLHGYTVQNAFEKFQDYMTEHMECSKKIIIITGRGKDGSGIIKKEMPLWLEKYQSSVSEIEDKNGAFLIKFKKRK